MANNYREDIADRRAKVWEMIVRGVNQQAISAALNVHRNTVSNDVKELRKQHRQVVKDADVHDEIGDTVAKYDEIFKYAMIEYSTADKETHKAQFLDKAMSALQKKVSLLVETGVLPKAAQEITGKMIIQGVDVSKASLEELKVLRGRMISQLDQSGQGVNRIAEYLSDGN